MKEGVLEGGPVSLIMPEAEENESLPSKNNIPAALTQGLSMKDGLEAIKSSSTGLRQKGGPL
jgi:hypothetical protein